MIRLGFEPKTYCLEGSCSIQLSYQTPIGCKGKHYFRHNQISDLKSDVTSVIEGVVAFQKCLCSLEFPDIQRIITTLFLQTGLALCKCRFKEGVAVGGKYDFPRLEVEGIDRDILLGNAEAVDDGIEHILVFHILEEWGDDHRTGGVALQLLFFGNTFCKQFADAGSTKLGKLLLMRLRIFIELTIHEALTVANHPYLTLHPTIDNRRSGQPLLWVFL